MEKYYVRPAAQPGSATYAWAPTLQQAMKMKFFLRRATGVEWKITKE